MAEKVADGVMVAAERPAELIKRFCNEIQLFDLCELEKCGHKQGLFCTSKELLNRFEAIAEEDARLPDAGFISDELDDGETTDDDGFDDAFDDEEFGDADYEEDQEDQEDD